MVVLSPKSEGPPNFETPEGTLAEHRAARTQNAAICRNPIRPRPQYRRRCHRFRESLPSPVATPVFAEKRAARRPEKGRLFPLVASAQDTMAPPCSQGPFMTASDSHTGNEELTQPTEHPTSHELPSTGRQEGTPPISMPPSAIFNLPSSLARVENTTARYCCTRDQGFLAWSFLVHSHNPDVFVLIASTASALRQRSSANPSDVQVTKVCTR